MTGTRSLTHSWGPWAGGGREKFEQSDVVAFGKLKRWGDARVHYLVRLVDGIDLFVNAMEQEDADRVWLRLLGAKTRMPSPTRDCGWAIAWQELACPG